MHKIKNYFSQKESYVPLLWTFDSMFLMESLKLLIHRDKSKDTKQREYKSNKNVYRIISKLIKVEEVSTHFNRGENGSESLDIIQNYPCPYPLLSGSG